VLMAATRVARIIFALVIHCSALAGCYAIESAEMNAKRYSHRTADQQQFMADKHECLQEAQQAHPEASFDGAQGFAIMYSTCMGARGYQEDPNGALGG
jgi:hypothetical protein